ncbi:vegetative incompatibility protein het-e-1 [Moniliophthora roreri]|uniref:Uncharacterized protein n=1 Tax=Moniliophthora roreri TaxID=221103 RepID=A0A0W0FZY9_MONRR|nr:vegetative incompatibility protein het-e-1 [Moniliophthora roreri]
MAITLSSEKNLLVIALSIIPFYGITRDQLVAARWSPGQNGPIRVVFKGDIGIGFVYAVNAEDDPSLKALCMWARVAEAEARLSATSYARCLLEEPSLDVL